MVTNLFIIRIMALADSRFLVESLRDLILDWMMRPSLRRKEVKPSTFQRKHRSMVINHSTILMEVSADSKSQEENLRDQTLVWMMRPSLRRKEVELSMFQKKHRSTVTNLFIIRMVVSADSKSQEENLRDQILVWMMIRSLRRKEV